MLVNLTAMTVLIEGGVTNVLAAKIVGTGVAFIFNYVTRQFIIYSKRPVTFKIAQNRILGTIPVKIMVKVKHTIKWIKRLLT